jgi:ferredoxin
MFSEGIKVRSPRNFRRFLQSVWRKLRKAQSVMQIDRYHKNVSGPFYVMNNQCIACGAPYQEAPDLIEYDDVAVYPHCYFKKQPETPDELERAIRACCVSCVRAVRYAGEDPAILKGLRELGSDDSCDAIFDPRTD